MTNKGFFFFYGLLLVVTFSFGQSSKQKQLEKRRSELQREISRVNKLLFNTQKKGKDLLSNLESINKKIQVRTDLIRAISAESNYLKAKIIKKENDLAVLKKELDLLKNDYADMILKSYQSKSEQNKLMFLLSSKDFFQAYKRFRYMQQYADFRKIQGDSIVVKSERAEELKRSLEVQKQKNQHLLAKNKKETERIKLEKESQEGLVKEIKSKEKTFISQIQEKQKEEKVVEKQIERVIREAIAASNKIKNRKTTVAKTSGFSLTPQGKALASRFEQNRGKLPWPVTEGVVTRKYGVIPHPTLGGIKIDSKGIHVTTKRNASARAVFKGTVLAIQSVSGRHAVYIQHGNYISLYNNLDKVYVTKGQQVVLKQSLGTVFTDKVTGKTVLKFQIWRDTNRQNPTYWLAKM